MSESTAVARPKTSVLERMLALATTPEERERAFQLAERHAQNQLVQEITAELTAKSWGSNVSPTLRVETVRWALEVGADPTSEVDILGGKPYLNANYWIRLVSVEPDFLRAEEVWVHEDPRATPEVNAERQKLRVKWAVPDEMAATVGLHRDQKAAAKGKPAIKVIAAVLVILHFSGGRGPFVGKKWSPSRANDDVGMDHPESSALTRAWRKAALHAVRRKPPFSQRLTNVMVTGRAVDNMIAAADARNPSIGGGPVATEDVAVQSLAPPKTGVIEKHEPSGVCGVAGDHKREECGYFKSKQVV